MSKENTCLPEQYREMTDDLLRIARESLAMGKDIDPTMFIIDEHARVVDMVPAQFHSDRDKTRFAEMVRQLAARHNAAALLMVSEAWGLPEEWLEPEKNKLFYTMYNRISDAPFKLDVLFFKLETADGEWNGQAQFIDSVVDPTGSRWLDTIKWKQSEHKDNGIFSQLLINNAGARTSSAGPGAA